MSMRTHTALALVSCVFLTGCGTASSSPSAVPTSTNVDVPFTSQAPAGDWSEPWQSACEETSIYMITSFYANDPIKRDQAIVQIKAILAVKDKDIKVSKDESLTTISQLIVDLKLPWETQLVTDPTTDALKKELAAGRPIIVPVYAPDLKNPHYSSVTPDYHVLVLTGYDDTNGVFIVNDPGTKDGEGLRFPYATLMFAIHDLDPQNVTAGKKAVLFTKEKTDWFGVTGSTK